jgi:hypothetical protein
VKTKEEPCYVSDNDVAQTDLDALDRGCVELDKVIEATETAVEADDFSPEEIEYRASFDLSTERGRLLFVHAENAVHTDLMDLGEFQARVCEWVCWRKDVQRMDGVLEQDAWVCCLFLEDGRTISTASKHTVRQWANIVRVYDKTDDLKKLTLRFVPNKSKIKGGNPWYGIIPVLPPSPPTISTQE